MKKTTRHAFVFIEVFGCEGGIQSYIQDVLSAYAQTAVALPNPMIADVFLLRDPPESQNIQAPCFNYRYFKDTSKSKNSRSMTDRVRLTLALATYLIKHRPERVYCGHINLATMVSQLCRTLKVPYTILTYGKEVWHELPSKEKKALAAADSIWTISRYSRDLASQANGIPKEKFKMLPCVVDGTDFQPGTAPEELIQQYQLQDSRVLTTVARLWKGDIYKGVDVTIRALPKIAAAVPNVKYVVIGRGDDQPRLARLAEELNVADRVVFAGFVPDEALIDHYRLADVYVMPSQEGFGIVYLEAMACGIPVIAGDDDGSADPLQDGQVGWQVPHRDSDAVAAACIEALIGTDRRCDGVWLRQQTLAKFSTAALTTTLIKALNIFVEEEVASRA